MKHDLRDTVKMAHKVELINSEHVCENSLTDRQLNPRFYPIQRRQNAFYKSYEVTVIV